MSAGRNTVKARLATRPGMEGATLLRESPPPSPRQAPRCAARSRAGEGSINTPATTSSAPMQGSTPCKQVRAVMLLGQGLGGRIEAGSDKV